LLGGGPIRRGKEIAGGGEKRKEIDGGGEKRKK